MDYKDLFLYDKFSGYLYWKKTLSPRCPEGSKAGSSSSSSGYVQVQVNKKMIAAHRIIYEMEYGKIPEGMVIDHINGCKTDNRLENLRLATKAQNVWNAGIRSTNTSGYRGVSWSKRMSKWQAQIRAYPKVLHIGFFETKEDAYQARLKAEKEYHKEFAYSQSILSGVL